MPAIGVRRRSNAVPDTQPGYSLRPVEARRPITPETLKWPQLVVVSHFEIPKNETL
jgi:hypothetical protein